MTLTPEQMREDLRFLRDTWAPLDRSFTTETREQFESLIADAMAAADTMSPADLELEVMRAVTVARNGHSSVRSLRFLRLLPVRSWWFADGLYVVSAHSEFERLLGARIDNFGSLPAEHALTAVAPYIAGTEQRVRYLSAFYLMSPDVLHRIGASDQPDAVTVTFRLRDRTAQPMRLGPAPSFDPGIKMSGEGYFGFAALIPSEGTLTGRWLHVLDPLKERPLAYRHPTDMSFAWINDGTKILYVRSNQVRSRDQRPLDQKLVFECLQNEVVPRRPKYVIVDLRLNQGGNFLYTILFTQALPRMLPPDGRIFVLVGRGTFSAALVTAAMLKANGGDRTVLIGETMGDANRFWAEGGNIALPHSEIEVRYSDGFHDWAAGCSDLDTCYWAAVAFGVRHISLAPEVYVEPTFADYAAGHDPALAAALALAR